MTTNQVFIKNDEIFIGDAKIGQVERIVTVNNRSWGTWGYKVEGEKFTFLRRSKKQAIIACIKSYIKINKLNWTMEVTK